MNENFFSNLKKALISARKSDKENPRKLPFHQIGVGACLCLVPGIPPAAASDIMKLMNLQIDREEKGLKPLSINEEMKLLYEKEKK